MKKLNFLIFSLFFFYALTSNAAQVDTVSTYSNAMKKTIKAIVVAPDSYKTGNKYPVLYLLHGYGGDYANWINKVPEIKNYADLYQMLIVCPDGNVGSWYFDSPIDPAWKYETYVATELVNWIDKKYKTINNRNGRAITGLSMGGHGALYLAIRHQDVFGAVGSMSGGVDITPFPKNWDIAKRLGTLEEAPEQWRQNSVINMVHLLKPKSLAIIFDCGTSDFFYNVNLHLHQELIYRNIPHDFVSRPGSHTWEYWANSIQYQAQFFADYFKNH